MKPNMPCEMDPRPEKVCLFSFVPLRLNKMLTDTA